MNTTCEGFTSRNDAPRSNGMARPLPLFKGTLLEGVPSTIPPKLFARAIPEERRNEGEGARIKIPDDF